MAGDAARPFEPAWLDALEAGLAANPAGLPGDADAEDTGGGATSLALGQEVLAVPGLGDVCYVVDLSSSEPPRLRRGTLDGAEVTLVAAYDAALALVEGRAAVHDLLTEGRIKVRGDARALVAAGALVARYAEAVRGEDGR